MKILIADPLSEKGHLNFNLGVIEWFKNDQHITIDYYVSEYMQCAMQLVCKVFPDRDLDKTNIIKYKIKQLKILNDIISYANNHGYDKLIFLSYEVYSTAVYMNFMRLIRKNGLEIYLIEHNTIPTSFLKNIFYSIIPKKNITHIGLVTYISEYIKNKYKKNSLYIPHPMRKLPVREYRKEKTIKVFMPSFVEQKLKNEICDSFRKLGEGYLLCTKGMSGVLDNIIFKEYYDNYDEELTIADAIFIPQYFDYRVSGVFYEALQTHAKIFMSNCIFSQYMKTIFKDKIIIIDSWEEYICNHFVSEMNIPQVKKDVNENYFNHEGLKIVRENILCL
ncbi:hypothetical protein QPL12_16795 [Escherichia coli]|nr:hypothetical protein [Escherichia coli]EFK4582296.1 hypothetical protein [Escherichia coli]MDS1550093.1 hypothetical protein [Escherichia coli]MEA1174855.1 hypothetical protein [Escherichia coli]